MKLKYYPIKEGAKLCVNCYHYSKKVGMPPECTHPSVVSLDLVDGTISGPSCSSRRVGKSKTTCGVDGKHWEKN